MIAIKGHLKRGREVIQLLESLGGINKWNHIGECVNYAYYIDHCDNIYSFGISGYHGYRKIYTLEEFEKEFPFKVGDKVITKWGSVGIIRSLTPDNDEIPYCIEVEKGYIYHHPSNLKFYKEMKEERNIKLTLDKAKEWYKKGGELKEIALQAFTEKELNPLPKSWEEFCENNPIQDREAFINYASSNVTICKECAGSGLGVWKRKPEKDRCKCVSQKSAEAHLAMIQLEQLRDCWRQGWKPEYHTTSYAIKCCNDEIHVIQAYSVSAFLSFPTKEMAEDFLVCFRDLIEKAGDLI